ncbi:MAG: hypothetical protein MUE99_00870 [Chitinophagaceae bacterium]|nr:hypothetical protein [Chitinophagaceae bacterium]
MLKTAGFTFGSRVGAAAINFGLIIAISQLLGPSERGHCSLYLVILMLIAGVSDIMAGAATSFLVHKYFPPGIYKLNALWALIPSLLIPIGWYLFAAISIEEAAMLMIFGWVHCRFNLQQQLLLAFHFFTRFNLNSILFPLSSAVLFLFFWKMGIQSAIGYLMAIGLAWGLIFISNQTFLRRYFSNKEQDFAGVLHPNPMDLIRPGILNQAAHIVSLLNNRFVFFLLPATGLGLWSNVLTISEAVFMIPGSLGQIIYALSSGKKRGEDGGLFRKAFMVNLFASFAAVLVLVLIPEQWWLFLFGQSFSGIRELLLLLLPGLATYGIYLIISYMQSSEGKFEKNLYPLLIAFGINIGITGWYWLQDMYILEKGIIALSFSWVFAAVGAAFIRIKSAGKSLLK